MQWRKPQKQKQYLEEAANEPLYCDLRFQGQLYDKETGLYYNRHRYYDSEICQYISPDPIGMQGGLLPQAYVHNPVEWVDPLGLSEGCCDDIRVGRWMSLDELEKMKETNRIQEGSGGMTFVTTSDASSFRKQAKLGAVYVEFDVSKASLLKGGKPDWFKTIGPTASKSQIFLLKKQGGEFNPTFRNLSGVIEIKGS